MLLLAFGQSHHKLLESQDMLEVVKLSGGKDKQIFCCLTTAIYKSNHQYFLKSSQPVRSISSSSQDYHRFHKESPQKRFCLIDIE
jgi:hypothetical protein